MNLLITEVTEMHGDHFCVAGWRAHSQQMVRPLPNGANWTHGLLSQHGVIPGATLQVASMGIKPHGAYPHFSEDTPVDSSAIKLLNSGPSPWFGANAPPVSTTLDEAFEGHVQHNKEWNGCLQGIYIPANTPTRSLWGLVCDRANISFVEAFGKLKAQLYDGSANYQLAVSSHTLKETWRTGGLPALHQALPMSGKLHIRLGLARAFADQPDKCYVMINGVQW